MEQDKVKPLGGKVSTGTVSPEHAEEMAKDKEYREALHALSEKYPIHSEERAFENRKILVKRHPYMEKGFEEMGYKCS